MKTLSSKEDEFSLSLKVNCLIMVVVIISVMRIITSLAVNFLRMLYHFTLTSRQRIATATVRRATIGLLLL